MRLNLLVAWDFVKELSLKNVADDFRNIRNIFNGHDDGSRVWSKVYAGSGSGLPSGDFFATGSFGSSTVQKTAAYTATVANQIILVDSTSATVTITLPTAVSINGRRYTVKDWKGKAATNNITIATTSSQTIDGVTTKVLTVNYQSYTVVSDGANWAVI